MNHINNGNCTKCDEILDRYSDFNYQLRTWFKSFQQRHPEFHCSCAGRGRLDQEAAVINRVSKAKWGESSHNYNCALDLFELYEDGQHNIYERDKFDTILKPELPDFINWYGLPGSPYYELPHIEVKMWKTLVKNGLLKLVE